MTELTQTEKNLIEIGGELINNVIFFDYIEWGKKAGMIKRSSKKMRRIGYVKYVIKSNKTKFDLYRGRWRYDKDDLPSHVEMTTVAYIESIAD